VRLIKLDDGDRLVALAKVEADDAEETGGETAPEAAGPAEPAPPQAPPSE
jgi:hypothetical protein